MKDAAPQAFFQASGGASPGQRLYLYHPPGQGVAPCGAVLYVPPFAEEMNKARRMAALQSRALAASGYAVLQPDLLGCGDSTGDFGDATWEDWVRDVGDAALWLHRQHPGTLWLWGLRAGALLACAAAARLPMRSNFLFWQPAVAGRPLLQQFLRLKAAGGLLEGGAKGIVDGLRQQLANGQSVSVAGYSLRPELARGLEAASLAPPEEPGARVEWFEVQSQGGGTLSPTAAQAVDRWQQAGCTTRTHVVAGPAFWQTTEIEVAPDLLAGTTSAMSSLAADCGRRPTTRPAAATAPPLSS